MTESTLSHDPAGAHKIQQARERDAVLAVIRPAPSSIGDDLAAAKAHVGELEERLAKAKARPTEQAATDPVAMRNLQTIGYLGDELHWTKRRVEDLERAEQVRAVRRMQAENPEASCAFEIRSDDGRKAVVQAIDLPTARKLTQPGWTVTGRINIRFTPPRSIRRRQICSVRSWRRMASN